MKRMHIHMSVKDLDKNITFYTSLFGTAPTVLKEDYAKWKMDDPAVNFAISTRQNEEGINHLGIQTDSDEELQIVASRLKNADIETVQQDQTACCYSESNKYWSFDPQGMAWEAFNTIGDIPLYGEKSGEVPKKETIDSKGGCRPNLPWENKPSSGCC